MPDCANCGKYLTRKNPRCYECGRCSECCSCEDGADTEGYDADQATFDRDELGEDPEED